MRARQAAPLLQGNILASLGSSSSRYNTVRQARLSIQDVTGAGPVGNIQDRSERRHTRTKHDDGIQVLVFQKLETFSRTACLEAIDRVEIAVGVKGTRDFLPR